MTFTTSTESAANRLSGAIDRAARYLPAQGPIDVFVAQNPLAAFEDEPFEEAVIRASRLYGAEPFLPESSYRDAMSRGRIRLSDLDGVLAEDLAGQADERLAGGRVSLRELHRVLLLHGVRQESDAAVRWTLTESDLLERLRWDLSSEARSRLLEGREGVAEPPAGGQLVDFEDELARRETFLRGLTTTSDDAEREAAGDLWHACVEAVSTARPAVVHDRPPVRHRDLILASRPSLDTDSLVHPLLIRLVAAFLDQGVARWTMPDRNLGLLAATTRMYASSLGPIDPWAACLPRAVRAVAGKPAIVVVEEELDRLGVPESHREEFLLETLLALRGWAGMVRQLEERPDRAPVEAVPARLVDFVAVRLLLDRVAVEWAAGRLGFPSVQPPEEVWAELRDRHPPRRGPGSLARAFLLHQVSQLLGISGQDIRSLDENEILRFEYAIASFDGVTRRKLFHRAYERRHAIETLDAIAAHAAAASPPPSESPEFQAIFCIDERCESFRRGLEESRVSCETYGAAGFFGVAMYYRGVDDWHASPLCPIVMRPSHTVVELAEESAAARHGRWRTMRRRVGRLAGGMDAGSRTLVRGSLVTAIGGAIAAVPLVARVAFPRLSARLGRKAVEIGRRRIPTRLAVAREDAREAAGPEDQAVPGTRAGFDVGEMADAVEGVLREIGLADRFASIVAVVGHGSSSLNNPHESAYDCGACGGGRGGPNARAFALMANDPAVRLRLRERGLQVPDDTWFVGGMLDTCSDGVTWFDVDRMPDRLRGAFTRVEETFEEVAAADAHERCRRFESAPLDIRPAAALAHVEARSVDLAQVRPELGHATNAVCVVGRRWRTRGLFLDRRAFLVSYDHSEDDDASILTRILSAVGPVTSGINLAYFFSKVDRIRYGCDTKLPHNITGLVGVMDGHASDLRTGLPWQTVEIHEPVRLLMVVEAPARRILDAADRLPSVRRLFENRWVRLASLDPAGDTIETLEAGGFAPYVPELRQLPVVARSVDWYRGHRGNMAPARVLAAISENHRSVRRGAS